MLENPTCPACDAHSWKKLKKRTFSLNGKNVGAFTRRRLQVLFEVWLPGEAEFVATIVRCKSCGFVCFTPRPTDAELDAKYRFLTTQVTKAKTVASISDLDRRRSAQIFGALAPFLEAHQDLLDYGGGRGNLLSSFVEHGLRCALVDYSISVVPGIEKVGSTLDELPPGRRFDVALSSHVFEHLADPLDIAWRIRRVLRPGGLLFVEVPLQTAGGVPKFSEPVTHVNFFDPWSMRVMLERAGYEVLLCQSERCLFASGAERPGVRAVARVAKAPGWQRKLPADVERNWRALSSSDIVKRLRRSARAVKKRLPFPARKLP